MSDSDHENVSRLGAFFVAFANRDFASMRAGFSDDFVWHVAAPAKFAGDRRGFDEFVEYLSELGRETGGTMTVTPSQIFANDKHGTALVTVYRERGSAALSNMAVQVVRFERGLVIEAWFLDENQAEIERFYSD